MKKVLLATSALVAFTGAAAANDQISLSGEAEMGIFDEEGGETQFWQDVDVKFSMEAESDSGLTFGAVVDLDEIFIAGPTSDDHGTYVYLKGSFGSLTMGDTDGALDWALTEAGNVGNPGSIADDETSHDGYLGSYGDGQYDGQVLRYDNTFGQFGVAISVEMDDSGVRDDGYALGLKYALDLGATTVNLGLGYQVVSDSTLNIGGTGVTATNNDIDIIGLSASAAFAGGFEAGLVYSNWDAGAAGDVDHTGIGLGYSSGAFAVHANYGIYDGSNGTERDGWGLAASYDLGGGLSAKFGYGADDASDTWSLGMSMKF